MIITIELDNAGRSLLQARVSATPNKYEPSPIQEQNA